jgi:hypothetical protein
MHSIILFSARPVVKVTRCGLQIHATITTVFGSILLVSCVVYTYVVMCDARRAVATPRGVLPSHTKPKSSYECTYGIVALSQCHLQPPPPRSRMLLMLLRQPPMMLLPIFRAPSLHINRAILEQLLHYVQRRRV